MFEYSINAVVSRTDNGRIVSIRIARELDAYSYPDKGKHGSKTDGELARMSVHNFFKALRWGSLDG